jgi:hypothetical protein
MVTWVLTGGAVVDVCRVAFLSALLACARGPAPAAGPDGGQAATQPGLLENPLPARHVCRVARERTDHKPASWSQGHALVATSAGKAFLARVERLVVGEPPFRAAPSSEQPGLVVSTMDLAGALGSAMAVPGTAETGAQAPAAASREGGFALVWTATDGQTIFAAAFDPLGNLINGPRPIPLPERSQIVMRPWLVAGPDGGFAVLYKSGSLDQPSRMFAFTLTTDLTLRGPPRPLGTGHAGDLEATATGYTAVWNDSDASRRPSLEIGLLDPAGQRATTARLWQSDRDTFPVGLSFRTRASADPALLAVEGGYLVAWTEWVDVPVSGLYQYSGGSSIVWLQRLDAGGVPQGRPSPLRASTAGVEEVEPSLLRFGDAVAVLWAHGSFSYVLGRGTPDHRVDLVLVDPGSLRPISNVVSVHPPAGDRAGGLVRRREVVLDRSILTTFDLTFHIHSSAASAAFTCDPL